MQIAKTRRIKGSLMMLCRYLLFFSSAGNLLAQGQEPCFLSADSLQRHGRIWLNRLWKYHAGDSVAWAQPRYDDAAWEPASTAWTSDRCRGAGGAYSP